MVVAEFSVVAELLMTFTLEEELCFEVAEPAEPEEEVDFGLVVGELAGAAAVLDGQLATCGSVTSESLEAEE